MAVIAGKMVYIAPVLSAVVYLKLSNIHQKKATKGRLKIKYPKRIFLFGITSFFLIINGKKNIAERKNLKNNNSSGDKASVIIATTGKDDAANILMIIIDIWTKYGDFIKVFLIIT